MIDVRLVRLFGPTISPAQDRTDPYEQTVGIPDRTNQLNSCEPCEHRIGSNISFSATCPYTKITVPNVVPSLIGSTKIDKNGGAGQSKP